MRSADVEDHVITLAYADDIALVSHDLRRLQETVNQWKVALDAYELKVNINKSEVMTVARVDRQSEIFIGDEKLAETEQFKYLGVSFSSEELIIK